MSNRVFKLGTRGSPLALWQAERVIALLKKKKPDAVVETVIIQTSGDKILDKPLVAIGGKGIFTKEIEHALQNGEVDFAVHSYKDLPTQLPEGLEIVCVPERESPFDALFSKHAHSLKELPEKPVIATGSLRRRAQVLSVRPDAQVVDIRGNVNTRLRKYEESDWDGLIMAHAAILRMEWNYTFVSPLSMDEMLPAPAQGALAVEARADDSETRELLASIHNEHAAIAVRTERAFLAALEGGCQVPIAAHAEVDADLIKLTGILASLDGKNCIRKEIAGTRALDSSLGTSLAEIVLNDGGEEIIRQLKAQG